ncbi:MAG: ion channel [Deltaproteobacteria bacterium]
MVRYSYGFFAIILLFIIYSLTNLFLELPYVIPVSVATILGGIVFIFLALYEVKVILNDAISKPATGLLKYWIISFSSITVGFSAIYMELVRLDPHSFVGMHDGVSSLYFSLVTFATVGYGDIYPLSMVAKLLVMTEVMASMILLPLVIAITIAYIIKRKYQGEHNEKGEFINQDNNTLRRIK